MANSTIGTTEIPPIYVSTPNYDDMGAILDRLDIPYSPVDGIDLSRLSEGIVLLNCSFTWDDEVELDTLEEFVARGGTLMASDLTSRAITHFTDAQFQSGGWGDEVRATVDDPELAALLGQNSVQLDFDTAIKEPTRLPVGAEPLLTAADRDSVIAYKFPHEQGKVVYTVFHNHSQPTDVEDALLQALLMVPIAEATNMTVTETYTTIVGGDESGGDTELLDADSGTPTQIYRKTTAGTETGIETTSTSVTVELVADDSSRSVLSRTLATGESLVLGRADFKDIVSDGDRRYISGQHLELRNGGGAHGGIEIRDTDSTNGTQLAGSDVSDGDFYTIEPGSSLSLADGRVTFTVRIE
jgi:hypothetical protein